MRMTPSPLALKLSLLSGIIVLCAPAAYSQGAITHQISLQNGQTWCADSMIQQLFTNINALRAQKGVPALKLDALGMKDAELRVVQFAAYMETHSQSSPGFNPHEGYDTTAASIGYNLISENLAWLSSDPNTIVYSAWQDRLHMDAMLAPDANVAGVSCIYSNGVPYWSYEPGICSGSCGQTTPAPGSGSTPTLDSEQLAFLSLINNYRAQNGAGPLKVSVALQNSSQWMSADMAAKNYASHTDSLGRSPAARMAAFGYTYTPNGENIAGGYGDAQNTFNQWRDACDADASGNCTYAHRRNMLSPSWVVLGIGRAYGPNSSYGWFWTTDFGGYLDQVITPGTTPPPGPAVPVIVSFIASPSSITSGQTSTLSWTVNGATSVSIDPLGDVTGASSRLVTPAQTTTYTLTARNSAGAATATAAVTVTPPATRDTQPPTAPVLSSAVARTATQVDLRWTASTDNVGVAGYQIIRNGSVLTALPASAGSYTDSAASPATTYTYAVRAYDAANNGSTPSNSIQVTTPVPPVSGTACPAPASNAFTGCYYSNLDLSGTPALVRTDAAINFDWYDGSPATALAPGNFSARWQGNWTLAQGTYTFTLTASDGVRMYIDGEPVIDRWRDQSPYMFTVRRTLSAGTHLLVVEYYDRSQTAIAHLTWQNAAPVGQPPVISTFTATPTSVAPGASTTLAWSVSGATTVTIEPGLGDVTGVSTRSVTPAAGTTYKLTASNAFGTVSAVVSVTVLAATGDTQSPSVPSITSAAAVSSTQVDLRWTASSDNAGVAGYQIIRNGSVLTTIPGVSTAYSDRSVAAATSYTYAVRAYDAAGNYSQTSTSMQVTTPSGGTQSGCPAPAAGAFSGCYYSNVTLSGVPAITKVDREINFDYTTGFPGTGVPDDNFSVRWQGDFAFNQGTYSFSMIASDGVRVYVDGVLIVDRWRDQPPMMYTARRTLTAGTHRVVVELYSQTRTPTAHMSWQQVAQ